jgi:hypothetical protein
MNMTANVTDQKNRPQESFPIVTIIATGLIFALIGFFLANAYPKASDINNAGFGIMLIGLSTFILGVFGTLAAAIKKRFEESKVTSNKKVLIASIWLSGIGLVLCVIGFLINVNFPSEAMWNSYSFITLLVGVCIFVIGLFASVATSIKTNFSNRTGVEGANADKPRLLLSGILVIGFGLVLAVAGFILKENFSEIALNYTGFGLLLAGVATLILGLFSSASTIIISRVNRKEGNFERKNILGLFVSLWITGLGAILAVTGLMLRWYIIIDLQRVLGFEMLLAGVAILIVGTSGSLGLILKSRFAQNENFGLINTRNRAFLASVLSTGLGAALLTDGFILSTSFAKDTIMNYTGFVMLLVGVAIAVFSAFELTRLYATCYLSNIRYQNQNAPKNGKAEKIRLGLKARWAYYFSARAVFNIAGIMTAIGLLFFSLWQLDLIVSGPVWYESGNRGWSWNKPGSYADSPFQCFLWKTTVGQAYDTLFMLVFISFVILFISAFFWPRAKNSE